MAKMEDEHQEAKRARTIRFEYNRDVESVQAWIQAAESKVQDKSVEPHKLKEFLQVWTVGEPCTTCFTFRVINTINLVPDHFTNKILHL